MIAKSRITINSSHQQEVEHKPPPKVHDTTPTHNHIKEEAYSTNSSDYSEFEFNDEPRETSRGKGCSRTVSTMNLNRMRVRKDDFIISSKELRHRNHKIFINISRLQDMIRNEGRRVENDPFIKYVSKLDERFFIDEKEFDIVLRASEIMRTPKREKGSYAQVRADKIRRIESSDHTMPVDAIPTYEGNNDSGSIIPVKQEIPSPSEKSVRVKKERVAKTKEVKQKRSKKNVEVEMDVDEELANEFNSSSEKEDSPTVVSAQQFEQSDSDDPNEFPAPQEWTLHSGSDSKYYNYQSLFPSPETARLLEEFGVTPSESVSLDSFDSKSVFVCI